MKKKYISLTNFGDKLEDEIDVLLSKLVHSKFLFKNPKIRNDNGKEKEFCDNLIFFNGTLVIIQSKTKDYTKLEDFDKYRKKCIDNAIKQLETSIRWSKDDRVNKKFKNNINEQVEIKSSEIKKIIAINISYFHQDKDFYITKENTQKLKNLEDIPNILTYQELKRIIELNDTLPDFLEYLDKRRLVVQKNIPLLGEDTILSYFFLTNRTMIPEGISKKEFDNMSQILIDESFEESLKSGDLKRKLEKRNEKNKNSYFIDLVINKTIPNIQGEQTTFFIELLNINRFNRRLIADNILPIYKKFIEKKQEFRAPFIKIDDNLGILFVFSRKGKDSEESEKILFAHTLLMKNKYKLKKIIGISENHFSDGTSNQSCCFLEGNIELDKTKLNEEYYSLLSDNSKVKKLKNIYEFETNK